MAKKKPFSVGGLGGPGTTGALFEGDVVGESLDKANPWLDASAEEAQARADALAEEAKGYWDTVQAPDIGPVDLQDYEWRGNLDAGPAVEYQDIDPRLADIETVDGTAFDDINVDPRLKDEQMASLDALREISDAGGLTAADKAVLSRISSRAAGEDAGRRGAIMQNMQQRGMGGSGMELLSLLQSNQAATDRAAQEGLDVAGMAQDRALQAIMEGGNLAGSIRGQDFGEQAAKAEAKDLINKFNAGTLNSGNQFNAGVTNDASKFNATNKLNTAMYNKDNDFTAAQINHKGIQDTANANTDLGNKQTVMNKVDIPQTNYDNLITATTGKSGAATKAADIAQNKADAKNKEIGEKKNAVIKIAGSMMSDEREKKEVSKIDPRELDEFFEAINGGKKFKYKDTSKPGTAEGIRIGIMAQDVKDTSLGKHIVKDTKDGLQLDTNNLLGLILASLSKGK